MGTGTARPGSSNHELGLAIDFECDGTLIRSRNGADAYPTVWLKAAALLQSVVNNHALVDGNKRLGWLATAVFLELNDASVATAPNDDVYELVMRVASSSIDIDEIADHLHRLGRSC